MEGNEKRRYRRFSPEHKYNIVKESLTTDTKVSEICAKHEVKSSHFYTWKDQFFQGAKGAFEQNARSNGSMSSAEQRELEELRRQNDRMKNVIAEITAENIDLKKNSLE